LCVLHAEALQVVAMQEPALHTLPEAAQSVQAPPPFPHAAFTFAATQPASPAQQVLQLLGPQGSPAS
jgi:hypothetical protein